MSKSPRPTFAGPTLLERDAVVHHVWGDDVAGHVEDWIYVSSDKIHQLVFGLPAGGWFRHSEANRTVFAADELYYVLEGSLLLSNPETGEVHRLGRGDAAFFRRDTWHHGQSDGLEPLRVLEYFSPPPSQGTSQSYAQTRPYLDRPKYVQDEWLGRWPMAAPEARARNTMRVLPSADTLWRLEGKDQNALVGILVSTEHLTAGTIRLRPGARTDTRAHGGDAGLYHLMGDLQIEVLAPDATRTYGLEPQDGFFVPEGISYRLYNQGSTPAEIAFGIGPKYLAVSSSERR